MSQKIQVTAKIVERDNAQYVINYGEYYQSDSGDCTNMSKATCFAFVDAVRYLERSYPADSVWMGRWQNRDGESVYVFNADI